MGKTLSFDYKGQGAFSFDGQALDAWIAAGNYGLPPGGQSPEEEYPGRSAALFVQEAHNAGALAGPADLDLIAIGDDDEGPGLTLQLGERNQGEAWYITPGWRGIGRLVPPLDEREHMSERDRMVYSLERVVVELNSLLAQAKDSA